MVKIIGVYKITNTVTGDFYIGSSKNIKQRWADHKCPSKWSRYPNNPMYLDFQKYGVEKFDFQILKEVETESLKEAEQQFIETLKPTYNSNRAKGLDIERLKEYHKSVEYKESHRKSNKKYHKKYDNQPCRYNGEVLTLRALYLRFYRAGIEHPATEAKKYIIKN